MAVMAQMAVVVVPLASGLLGAHTIVARKWTGVILCAS